MDVKQDSTWVARLESLGFELWDTGGGCTGYIRERGSYQDQITTFVEGEPTSDAPTQLSDRVYVGTSEIDEDGAVTGEEVCYWVGPLELFLKDRGV